VSLRHTKERGNKGAKLLALLLLGGRGSLGCLGLGHPLLKLIDATGRIYKLLLARVKWMARVANTHDNRGLRGAGLNRVTASATYFRVLILWMNLSLHTVRAG
jgi:hypothetical protein